MLSHHLSSHTLNFLKSEMYYNKQSKKLFMVVLCCCYEWWHLYLYSTFLSRQSKDFFLCLENYCCTTLQTVNLIQYFTHTGGGRKGGGMEEGRGIIRDFAIWQVLVKVYFCVSRLLCSKHSFLPRDGETYRYKSFIIYPICPWQGKAY